MKYNAPQEPIIPWPRAQKTWKRVHTEFCELEGLMHIVIGFVQSSCPRQLVLRPSVCLEADWQHMGCLLNLYQTMGHS